MIKDKLKKALSITLALTIALGTYTPTNASTLTKKKIVDFSEMYNGSSRSMDVDIPNVNEIVNVKILNTEGGNANASIIGKDKVRVNVSGGNPSRQVWNSTKYSQYVTESRTSSNNSFANSISVTRGSYSGGIGKSGSSRVISGSYIPGDTKWVTNQTSSWYNDGVYSGSLSQYVYSGSLIPGVKNIYQRRY